MAAKFTTTDWIWRDGEFIRWEAATIHVMSHVVHYGSSVFEGIRCYSTPDGPAIFRLPEHLRRLRDSAKVYRMHYDYSEEALTAALRELILKNELEECYIRPVVIRGYGTVGVNPTGSPVETYLVCWPWGTYLGEGALERGVDVCVSSWARPAPNTLPAMAKAGGNYLSSQLIKMEAVANGYDEGIALAPSGIISEGSGQNLFLVRDGVLITPPLEGTLLQGITRDSVITLARDMDLPVREQAVPREALYMADELFFTGTAAEVTPIRSVDDTEIGTGSRGPVTEEIQQQFFDLVEGRLEGYGDWFLEV